MNKTPPKNAKHRLGALLRRRPGAALLLGCYGAALAVALGWHLWGFAANRAAYASGALAYAELTLDDFTPVDMERRGDVLFTLGGDPQLVLTDAQRRVENLEIELSYSKDPLLETAYWATPGQEYALRRMAYPGADGTYLLPPGGGQSLRFDPGTVAGNEITFKRAVINTRRPFWAFFLPSAGEVASLAVLPGLVAAALMVLWQSLPGKKGVTGHG